MSHKENSIQKFAIGSGAPQMNVQELIDTARTLVAGDKGLAPTTPV
jgi:hypothetical protein